MADQTNIHGLENQTNDLSNTEKTFTSYQQTAEVTPLCRIKYDLASEARNIPVPFTNRRERYRGIEQHYPKIQAVMQDRIS